MMAAHAYKFAPGRAVSSMANSGHRLADAANAGQTLNARFRAAVAQIKAATGQSSSQIADALHVDAVRFNHWMKTDESRTVTMAATHAAEALAQSVKSAITDEEIVQAARELAIAKARWERIEHGLMEGVA